MTIVVFGGFGLVLLVTACIVADVVAGVRRSGDGVEKTAGRVTRVRGPVRGQLDSGATAECLEVTVEYYTRHGDRELRHPGAPAGQDRGQGEPLAAIRPEVAGLAALGLFLQPGLPDGQSRRT